MTALLGSPDRSIGRLIRERLSTISIGMRSDYDLNPHISINLSDRTTPAAVLVPIVCRKNGLTIILTQRSDSLRDHPGQVSFPGGRAESDDTDPEDTALREAYEEIGLHSRYVELLGRLDTYKTRTGFEVVPVVGMIDPSFDLKLDCIEVSGVFEVPLAFILDPTNHQRHHLAWKGTSISFYALPYESHYIWGATAGMLVNLYVQLSKV